MKNLIYPLLALFLILTQSCDTEIPESDNTAPTFTFMISGDGFSRTFTQDDDFDSFILFLRDDAEYSFVYSAGDPDGVKLIQWQLPSSDVIEFTDAIVSPWTIRDLSFLSRMIEWLGNPSSPTTGNILARSFRTNGDGVTTSFGFFASDYEGGSGSSNTVSATLNISIGNHDTEVVSF